MKDFFKRTQFQNIPQQRSRGQNVNKVETSVTVLWKVAVSELFKDDEKILIQEKLKTESTQTDFYF